MTGRCGPLTVPAITLHRPWPWAILHAGKDIENRAWIPPKSLWGSDLYLHAGQAWDEDADAFLASLGITPPPEPDHPAGAIVGVVRVKGWHGSHACVRTGTLADIHPEGLYSCSRWAMGPCTGHWELADARPVEPVGCRGWQRLWYPQPLVAAAVDAQLPRPAAVGV